ncbi:MAG: histidine kinase [Bacteroidota bacterium]
MDEGKIIDDFDIIFMSMLGMFILATAIISFVIIYQRKLLHQERKLAQTERIHQQSLLNAAIESQEQERLRVGKELHDSIGVMLSTIGLHLQYFRETAITKDSSSIDKIEGILNNTIDTVRGVSADLRPVILEDHGLIEAVNELLLSVQTAGKIETSLSEKYHRELAKDQELMIYRITQELLTNTIRHAQASEISIDILSDNIFFTYIYQDNGIGLRKTQEGSNSPGLGLKNIESRVQALNGELSIGTAQKGGMKLTLKSSHT